MNSQYESRPTSGRTAQESTTTKATIAFATTANAAVVGLLSTRSAVSYD